MPKSWSPVDFLQQDRDKLFSYYTKQQVNVLDRTLGITEKFLMACVAVYVIGFVFIQNEGYLEQEQAKGMISTMVSGQMVAQSTGATMKTRMFSAEEITYPGLENGNIFITTRLESVEQSRGVCEDTAKSCDSPDDCSANVGASCSENFFCVEPSWCAAENVQSEVYKLPTDKMRIWVKSSISFVRLVPGTSLFYSTMMDSPVMYPQANFNTFTVRDLLLLCEPPVRFEEIAELGAAIEVQFIWKCKVDSPFGCMPTLVARRVDSLFDADNIGFEFRHADFIADDKRLLETRRGIRLYLRTVGTGEKISPTTIIFKMSTGMALLGFAPLIADFIMLNCFGNNSKKYRARKYIETGDFSEYFEKVDTSGAAVEEEDDEDEDAEHEQDDEVWKSRMDADE